MPALAGPEHTWHLLQLIWGGCHVPHGPGLAKVGTGFGMLGKQDPLCPPPPPRHAGFSAHFDQSGTALNALSAHFGTRAASDVYPRPAGVGATCNLYPRLADTGTADWFSMQRGSERVGPGLTPCRCCMLCRSWSWHFMWCLFHSLCMDQSNICPMWVNMRLRGGTGSWMVWFQGSDPAYMPYF